MTEKTTDPRLTGCADGGACVFMERHDAETARLRAALRYLLAFPGATEAQRRAREALGDE